MNKFNFFQTAAYAILKKQLDETGGEFTGTMDDIANGSTYVKTHNDLLYKITVGTTEPATPSTGDLWVDTN